MILLTRPKQQSEKITGRLKMLGYETLILPLLKIKNLHYEVKDKRYDAIIVTSQNSISFLHKNQWIKSKLIYTAGDVTKNILESIDCEKVISANGNAKDLNKMLVDKINIYSKILYLRGNHISYDIIKSLKQKGFYVIDYVVYHSIARRYIREKILKVIKESVFTILFYSQRSAGIFFQLAKKYSLDMKNKQAICISNLVAEKVQKLDWCKISISKSCNENSMLELLND